MIEHVDHQTSQLEFRLWFFTKFRGRNTVCGSPWCNSNGLKQLIKVYTCGLFMIYLFLEDSAQTFRVPARSDHIFGPGIRPWLL